MANILTREKAEALCTIILLGHCVQNNKNRKSAHFQFQGEDDKTGYDEVFSLFQSYSVAIQISQSRSKSVLPIILAKTNRILDIESAEAYVTDAETAAARSLEASVPLTQEGVQETYYGAYIGGFSSSVSRMELIGASSLSLLDPEYRDISDDEQRDIRTSYSRAKKDATSVLSNIKSKYQGFSPPKKLNGINITTSDLDDDLPVYVEGKLFGSYHGMIKSLCKFLQTSTPNDLIFEIAYSPGTSKVSSCFPCTIFMIANERPPTSIHLGRGDNWRVPESCPEFMKKKWADLVYSFYQSGRTYLDEICRVRGLDYNSVFKIGKGKVDELYGDLDRQGEHALPAIFLESLTFESSFSKKIMNTLYSLST